MRKRGLGWSILCGASGSVLFALGSCGVELDCKETQTCRDSSGESGGSGAEGPGGESGSSAGDSSTGGVSGSAGTSGASASGGAAGSAGTSGAPASGGAVGSQGGGGAGDGGQAGGAGTGGEGGIPDVGLPTIVRVSPSDGARGVHADENVVITFSEPMDRVATAAALASPDVALGPGSFTWSVNDTVLTVDLPPFTYRTGDDPLTVVASNFRFTVGTGARDVDGNHLESRFDFAFRTLRDITQRLRPVRNSENPSTEYWAWSRTLGTSNATICESGAFAIGSFGGASANMTVGYVAMDIAELPNGIVDFKQATFIGSQQSSEGIPFDFMGVIRLTHLAPLPINQGIAPASLPEATPLLDLGPFASDPESRPRTKDVLAVLEGDYANRSARSNQSTFGLAFELTPFGPPFNPHYTSFTCASFVL
ncbi:MAG TPA: Ig-like domain-containing protein, partial [Polyangiaceae bacterium]